MLYDVDHLKWPFLALFPTIINEVTCIIVDAIKNPLKCEHHQL
jgi:hypothetical protein